MRQNFKMLPFSTEQNGQTWICHPSIHNGKLNQTGTGTHDQGLRMNESTTHVW